MGDWTPETRPYLRRYTSLPVLIDMLANRRLTLVDPKSWSDLNDTAFLAGYKKSKGLKSLLALCFTATGETYHHWNVFAPGAGGVCIEFDRDPFLGSIDGEPRLRHGLVVYREIRELEEAAPNVDDLPFLKRYPYRHEAEYRLIWQDAQERINFKHLDLDLRTISKIHLSPWHPKALRTSTEKMLRALADVGPLVVNRTTVLENARWKAKVPPLQVLAEEASKDPSAA